MQTRTNDREMKIKKMVNAVCLKVNDMEFRVGDLIEERDVELLTNRPNVEITVVPFDS